MVDPKVLGLLKKFCLLCQEEKEEKDCGQSFGEDESQLPPLQTKDKIEVPSQKTGGKSLDVFFLNGLANLLGIKLLKL